MRKGARCFAEVGRRSGELSDKESIRPSRLSLLGVSKALFGLLEALSDGIVHLFVGEKVLQSGRISSVVL